MKGLTLGDVLADATIREAAGYGSLKEANTMLLIDGQPVDENYVIKGGENIEVLKRAGEKA